MIKIRYKLKISKNIYKNQRYKIKIAGPILINILLLLLLFIPHTSVYAYIDAEGENLPPLASLEISKRRVIDINIANDGTTGYSTAALNSKLNERLKTRFAAEGIDYKVNVIDAYDKNINSVKSNLETVNFDTGKLYYPRNKIGPFGADYSRISGGIKGTVAYTVEPGKLTVSSYILDNEAWNDNINCANDRYLCVKFYSDYEKQNLISEKKITWSKIGRAKNNPDDSDNSAGNNLELLFSDDAKCFDILVSGYFTISSNYGGYFSYSLMQDGKNQLQWLQNLSVYSENIKRKAFICENASVLTWRQNAEKYYVDFSNRKYSENKYGEGKAASLLYLFDKNISLIKIGNNSTKEDARILLRDNDNKGLFINNEELYSAVNELAEYIISSGRQANAEKLEDGSYIVVSENEMPLAFEAGGIDNKGSQIAEQSALRTKEYIEVDNGGSYIIKENNSKIDYVNVYFYDFNLEASVPIKVATNNRFEIPLNICFIKLTCVGADTARASKMTIVENCLENGDILDYNPKVSDNENDSADIIFKFSHDNRNIAGNAITNQTEKMIFSGIELSAPAESFSKPGTYVISMLAKDMPKQTADTENLLINGNAEAADISGGLEGWAVWAENPGTTSLARRTIQPYILSGKGSFEISSQIQSQNETTGDFQSDSACFYIDIAASPNTSYKLSGLLYTLKCSGNFVIYEIDNNYNIIKSHSSDKITDSENIYKAENGVELVSADKITSYIDNTEYDGLKPSSVFFTTGYGTTKLRVHIVKYHTVLGIEPEFQNITDNGTGNTSSDEAVYSSPIANKAYLFADNITLVRMLPDTLFDKYRKTSIPAAKIIYAHRLPRAEFTYKIENAAGVFKIKKLADEQLSYDPDHTDKFNKGIINNMWRWAEISADGDTEWHNGKVPEERTFLAGTRVLIWYMVQDSDGINGEGGWSKPKVVSTDGCLSIPEAVFLAAPNPLPMQKELKISDQSYSPNYEAEIKSNWIIKKTSSGLTQVLTFDRTDTADGSYYKKFTGLGFGQFIITLSVTDSYGKVSKPCSKTINVIDNINPAVTVSQAKGAFGGEEGAVVLVTGFDSALNKAYNRGLKAITYIWSKNALEPQSSDFVQAISIQREGVYEESFTASQAKEGIWYLYVVAEDYAGNRNNENYDRFGPYTVEKIKAGGFFITMMLDAGWRAYYFDLNNGIDDNHDGINDRYIRRSNTDIGTIKMPINYYSLVGYERTYIKAGYKIKGKIEISGNPDYAGFNINYIKKGKKYTDTVLLSKAEGDTYTFEWIIPLETDSKTFVSFDLITKKYDKTYGNEKWLDTWDIRNESRLIFYVKGKAADDLIYVQSQ
ncbi:hypothetical protein LY28_00299 [Ruminiclostridium sufflavum DSM 19573]|uniref:Uncharacterized protein n=1 Tax=Ruminiclostridium sufflavum DSM 19573 TaxID=1121337 RepID=A0A318Y2C8_9FIRM|nr:hypothetical protein [Ruminiclostridium sufflavum]PYG89707.1 hypothetical protein LY28_00299 [Ruminiclostridium sufflavum DSM 19573]